MEDKDIEKLLKESADEVQVKDFSERWGKLKGRIDLAQEVTLKETSSETVLATSSNSNVPSNSVRKKLIYSLSAVFLAIALCLAIVLPIALKKDVSPNDIVPNDVKPQFLDLSDLLPDAVSGDEFYDQIEKTDLKIVNLEKFEVSSYGLLYTTDNKVVGGSFDISDEDEGILASILFYDATVTSSFDIGADYKTYSVNGFNIVHKAEITEDYYTITVKAVGSNISYELKCFALDENIESFFNKLFG